MNTSKKGRRNEHRARDQLLPGCRIAHPHALLCLRSAGSKGPADLIALCMLCRVMRLVQVKSNRLPGKAELERLKAFAGAEGPWTVVVEAWTYVDGDTTPRVKTVG